MTAYTRTPIGTALPFVLNAVKLFLRIDHNDEDEAIAGMANTAAAEIEAAADVALLAQIIGATFTEWGATVPLPVGPFYAAGTEDNPVTVQTRDEDGNLTTRATGWWIEAGRYPVLHVTEDYDGEALLITYPAGYGTTTASIPADLAHAISDQTGQSYDLRGEEPKGLSAAAARILARHRRVKA